MGVVTVQLPAILTDEALIRKAIERGAVVGMRDETEILAGEIKASPQMPVNRGHLRQSIESMRPVVSGGTVTGGIFSGGESSAYAAVMDLGRRAGKAMSWKFLYFAPGQIGVRDSWRGGWVNRKLGDWVEEIATVLRDRDKAKLKAADAAVRATSGAEALRRRARDGARRARVGQQLARESVRASNAEAYRRRACYLLARSIATHIRTDGIRARRFADGRRKEIADRVTASCTREITLNLARMGATR